MALKKGFCNHCEGDEKLRIFDVNREAEVCYCPHCTAPLKPKDAINNYRNLISHYLKKASKYLFESTEYLLAYQTFAHIIDLDDTIKVAYFGRILSLVYLSTLRESKINFAFLLHRQEASRFHYQETANEYFHFLLLLLDALDIYESRMKKRLTSHGLYYDTDCIVLYLKRIDEIRSYKDYISSEADYFVETNKSHFREVVDRVNSSYEYYDHLFSEQYQTSDGYVYAFNCFGRNSLPSIMMVGDSPQKVNHHIKPVYLNPKDNKKSQIRDAIYDNNLPLSRLVSISIPLAIIMLGGAVLTLILGLVAKTPVIRILMFLSSVVLASSSIMLFVLHFSFKNRLKKTYYNGTNPFIFK